MMANQNSETTISKKLGGESYSLRTSPIKSWPKTLSTGVLTTLSIPILASWALFASILVATPIRDSILSMFLPWCMNLVDKEFETERKELLRDVSGSVLDVGSGGGAYLKYCGDAQLVVAVEPAESLHPKIRLAGQDLQSLKIVKDMKDVQKIHEEGFDFVILGNVLCEVPDLNNTLKQVDAVLKPGGKVYFSEHVGRPHGTWKRSLQDTLNPMWRHIGMGCNCNRDSLLAIQRTDGWNVVSWTYEHMQVCMGPFVLGIVVKNQITQVEN